MTEAKDTQNKDKTATEKPKTTLSLGGGSTLSLKGGASAPRTQAPGTVAVEVRRRSRVSNAPSGSISSSQSSSSTLNAPSKAELEAKALILKQAQEENASRTSLPRRTTLAQVKAEEQQKKKETSGDKDGDDARAKELAEMAEIDALEKRIVVTTQDFDPVDRSNKFGDAGNALSYRDRMKKAEDERAAAAPKKKATIGERRNARLTVNQALNRDFDRDRSMSLAARKRAQEKARLAAKGQIDLQKIVREVIVPETLTVGELSNRMKEPGREVIKALMKMGVMATSSQIIDADTAELLIEEFGHKIRRVTDADVEIGIEGDVDDNADMITRAPVVTIMGHVDHGKTSLLDALRKTDVVAGEAGGITQHIGAYQVEMPSGQRITFLDTPGHAAFTEMRARGANVTDVVIIIVSAVDSIMPQTVEAISHAKAAGVPIIIAVNKIDLPDANPAKVKQDLLQYEVVLEEHGGDVQCVEISAKKRIGLDKLEEAILLQTEMMELQANPNREAHGFIIETKVETGRGSVATVLIQKGTLKIGNIFVAGAEFGKVRAIIDDKGRNLSQAGPGQPVEVLGINGTPQAGDPFNVVKEESRAREIAEYRKSKMKDAAAALAIKGRATMDDILLIQLEGEKATLPVIIKGDVHGSIEAIIASMRKLEEDNQGIAVKVLFSGVGGITESDVTLAHASGALIIGFNVRANPQARDLAARNKVRVQYYNVIYNVIEDTKAILTGMLEPVQREDYIGQAVVKEVFNITKVGKIAGCMVEVGFVKRGSKVRLLRDDVVIHEGMLKTLKRFKDEVPEVKEGTECGMAFEKYEDLKAGDIIECFDIIAVKREVI